MWWSAADDAQLGRFYAENDFVPELDGVSNEVFEMLDFAGIGRMMRCSENGVFVEQSVCAAGWRTDHRAALSKKRCRESRDTSSGSRLDCIPTLAMRAR